MARKRGAQPSVETLAAAGADEVRFVPLGGAGEIGMNLYLYGHDGYWLAVDFGIGFADDTMTGAEILVPDPSFMLARGDALVGLVLTHAHEDHIGAIQYFAEVLSCPIYATPFTAAVLRRKLQDSGTRHRLDLRELAPAERLALPPFGVELVTMTHSIPEPNALLVETPAGTVLHTGDWKLDPSPPIGPEADEARLRRAGRGGVLALICDSTNVLSTGESGSETEVRAGLTHVMGRCQGRVAVTCFSTNVARIESIAAAAAANDRHVALVGRSLRRIVDAARATGYLAGTPAFLEEDEAGFLPADKVCYICTGSQGEGRSALARIAEGSHGQVSLDAGDSVIFSSRVIPGNERAIARMQGKLMGRGVTVIVDEELEDLQIHVSGHPSRAEVERLYGWVAPRLAVPIHGEYRHLSAHAALARECGVAQTLIPHDGAVISLAASGASLLGDAPQGIFMVDAERLVPLRGESMKARRRLLHNGAVFATVVAAPSGELEAAPEIDTLGLVDDAADPAEAEAELDLHGAAEDAVLRLCDETHDEPDPDAIRTVVDRAVRRRVKNALAKKPVVRVHVVPR